MQIKEKISRTSFRLFLFSSLSLGDKGIPFRVGTIVIGTTFSFCLCLLRA